MIQDCGIVYGLGLTLNYLSELNALVVHWLSITALANLASA